MMANEYKIKLIYAGGTIGGVKNGNGETVEYESAPKKFEEVLREKLPKWAKRIEWELESTFRKLSENVVPKDWETLVKKIDAAICSGYRAVVVAHGTDTMIYSATAAAIMLHNVQVPIIFSGANEPLRSEETDAVQNLSHALLVASERLLTGVFISFAGSRNGVSLVLEPNDVRKEAYRLDCFQPVWDRPIAMVGRGSLFVKPRLKIIRNPSIGPEFLERIGNYQACIGIEPNVSLFQLHPGFSPNVIEEAVKRGTKGIILSAYGVGTACIEGEFSLLNTIKNTCKRDIPVFIVSQHYGSVRTRAYSSSVKMEGVGATPLGRMTAEWSLVKLMWALSQVSKYSDVVDLMVGVKKNNP